MFLVLVFIYFFYFHKLLKNKASPKKTEGLGYNISQKRLYSTSSRKTLTFKESLGATESIPHFLTGFTDAEGCFAVSITKTNKVASG